MTKIKAASDPAAENRRVQLRAWINHFFDGSQAAFGASTANTEQGERQINQGELSALLKTKSFGEKRARSLEVQAQMPVGYLDSTSPPDAKMLTSFLQVRSSGTTDAALRPPIQWPFRLVSYKRLQALRSKLGPKLANEAIRELDKYLDTLVERWEREAEQRKKQAATR